MYNKDEAVRFLATHDDPAVRQASRIIEQDYKRRKRILSLVTEAIQQLRVDFKYLMFDLECTKRERDAK